MTEFLPKRLRRLSWLGAIPALVAAGFTGASGGVHAQCTPEWRPILQEETFNGQNIRAVVEWDDGSGPALYLGGNFSTINGTESWSLVKFDGERCSSVGCGVNILGLSDLPLAGQVEDMVVWDADGPGPGKSVLVVAGQFTAVGGGFTLASNIAAWNGQQWMPLGFELGQVSESVTSLTYGVVLSIAVVVEPDNTQTLYACGSFDLPDDNRHIARWNGSSWVAVGNTVGVAGYMTDLLVHNDGSGSKLYVAGADGFNGLGSPNVARWNGSAWEGVGAGPNALGVFALETFDHDSSPTTPALLCAAPSGRTGSAGRFLNTWNGSSWSAHQLPMEPGETTYYTFGFPDMAVYNAGSGPKLYIGTGTYAYSGPAAAFHYYQVKAWNGTTFENTDTRVDVDAITEGDVSPAQRRGMFVSSFGGQTRLWVGQTAINHRQPIRQFNGITWGASIPTQGSEGEAVDAVMWDPDSAGPQPARLYCVGTFPWGGAAMFDGVEFLPLPALAGNATACAVFNNGTGEAFYAAVSRSNGTSVFRLSGSSWTAVGIEGGFYQLGISGGTRLDTIADLEVFDDGSGPRLYATGLFRRVNYQNDTLNGLRANNIARWNGSSWEPFGPGGNDVGFTGFTFGGGSQLLVHNDGGGSNLYASGFFTAAGGVSIPGRIARWNGTTWQPVGNPPDINSHDGTPRLISHPQGTTSLLFAGFFSSDPALGVLHDIWKWNGSSWTAASSGLGTNNALVVPIGSFDSGRGRKLYAWGHDPIVSLYGYSSRIFEWNGSSWSADVDGGLIVEPMNTSIKAFPFNTAGGTGVLLNGARGIGIESLGCFAGVNGVPASRMIARGCFAQLCPADFNGDNTRDVADLFAYINAWLAKTPAADFNADSSVDVADLFAYINAWLAGCD